MIKLFIKEESSYKGCNSYMLQAGYGDAKFELLTEFDDIEIEMLQTALSIYDSDMCRPDHHTREKLNALRDKIELFEDKGVKRK